MSLSIRAGARVVSVVFAAAVVVAAAQSPSITARADERLDVSAAPSGAVMRYTLDGSDPTRDAGEWLAPVSVPSGYTLKARAVTADGTPVGDVATWSAPPGGSRRPSTLVPVTQNRDWRVYDWTTRHREASTLMRSRRPDIVMLGDSITHFWGGEPIGGRRTGVAEWDRFFAGRSVVNLGYGWDRTENVLWRLDNGEFEDVSPKVVVLMIGTNNITLNTPEEIAAGVEAICTKIRERSPATQILLLAIFPRGQTPDATRAKVDDVNRLLARLDARDDVTFLDIGARFLEADGSISPDVMYDFLHPTAKGYAIWSAAMAPVLDRLLAQAAVGTTDSGLAIRNDSGLQLLVAPEHTSPVLRVVLPGQATSDRSIEILFPEHVTVRKQGQDSAQQLYMFRPGEGGDRPLWRRSGNALEYERDLRDGVHLLARATLESDGVRFRYEFTNDSRTAYDMIYAVTDPRLTGIFHDVRLERTYVHHVDGLDLLASEAPLRLKMPLDQWLPSRYLVSFTWPIPARTFERRDDGIAYYNKSRAVDAAFIATVSTDKAWVIASFARTAGNVWSNPELTCQHVDPQALLPPKQRATIELKMLVMRGSPDDALKRAMQQRESLK